MPSRTRSAASGYATRLQIDLEPVQPYVLTRNLRFDDLDELVEAIGRIVGTRTWRPEGSADEPVDFLDGVVFGEREAYLVLGRWSDEPPLGSALSDYTGQDIYYTLAARAAMPTR